MESVIFGAGYWGKTLKRGLEKYCGVRICAVITNNESRWGEKIDNVVISSPQILLDMNFERIFICAMNKTSSAEMEMQLLDMGIPREKIEVIRVNPHYMDAFLEHYSIVGLVKKNNYIYNFERYGKNITMFLPNYEEDSLQKNIVMHSDFFGSDELKYMRDTFLKGEDVILDIGANIGNHTVFFTKICNAEKVYAFEPVATIYDILCRNISLNHIEDRVVAHNVALGNVLGKARIKHFDPRSIGSTQIEEADDGNMSMMRLDDFEFERIDFIKIDVETYEYNLLQGAKVTLSKHSPVIFIEILDDYFTKVDELLRSYGYVCKKYVESHNYIYEKG